MSKRKLRHPRQLVRPIHYKQAGAVEEALRQRNVIAHVQPGWSGASLLVHVADPDVPAEYLDEHADALADALYADAVSISNTGRTFIVAPSWPTADDAAAAEAEDAAWPATDEAEHAARAAAADLSGAHTSLWPDSVKLVYQVNAFGSLQDALWCAALRGDGSAVVHLTADCDPAAVRSQLAGRRLALAAALNAADCRIGGSGRQVTITPMPQSRPVAAPGAERR